MYACSFEITFLLPMLQNPFKVHCWYRESKKRKEMEGIEHETHFQCTIFVYGRRRKYNQIYIRLWRDTWAHSREQIQFPLLQSEDNVVHIWVPVFYSPDYFPLECTTNSKCGWRREAEQLKSDSKLYKWRFNG